jgi:WD40 repeat protein
LLATRALGRTVVVWDATSGKERFHLKTEEEIRGPWGFSPDGKLLAAKAGDAVVVWDTTIGKERFTLKYGRGASEPRFSPDGKWLVTEEEDGTLRLWDLEPSR